MLVTFLQHQVLIYFMDGTSYSALCNFTFVISFTSNSSMFLLFYVQDTYNY